MSEAEPLSWMVLPDRHPVLAKGGEVAGYALAALGDQSNGRFDGIVVGIDRKMERDPQLMLEVDHIDALDTHGIHTNLSVAEIEGLPEYAPDQLWKASRKGRLDRTFDQDGSSAWDRM